MERRCLQEEGRSVSARTCCRKPENRGKISHMAFSASSGEITVNGPYQMRCISCSMVLVSLRLWCVGRGGEGGSDGDAFGGVEARLRRWHAK
jgi:hypothetical protein